MLMASDQIRATVRASAALAMRASVLLAVFAAGYLVAQASGRDDSLFAGTPLPGAMSGALAPVPALGADQVFELRTYTAAEGKYDALLARFRDHTMRIFENHGMVNVGYWTPQDEPLSDNTLVYIIAHPSREAAGDNWRAFGSDPEWQSVAEESQKDGRLIVGLESVFLNPTDFSPMR
jgi:NIPSNAP protein